MFDKQISRTFNLKAKVDDEEFQDFLSWQRIVHFQGNPFDMLSFKDPKTLDSEGFSSDEEIPEKELLGSDLSFVSVENEQKVWRAIQLLAKLHKVEGEIAEAEDPREQRLGRNKQAQKHVLAYLEKASDAALRLLGGEPVEPVEGAAAYFGGVKNVLSL